MSRFRIGLLLLVAAGAALVYAFYRQHRTQSQLAAQLYRSYGLLRADNETMAQAATGTVYSIEKAVMDNKRQPREVALLVLAEHLTKQADSLGHCLRQQEEAILRATGNGAARPTLLHPYEAVKVGAAGQLGTTSYNLRQQLARYQAALHKAAPTTDFALPVPPIDGQSTVVALVALARLEFDARVAQRQVLQQLAGQVTTYLFRGQRLVFASAESGTVAPGEKYRARLRLVNQLGKGARLHMRCNGKLVAVDGNGVGKVSFRVPTKPGPASWTGTITFKEGGRDTTFTVRVPYRVARP